MAILVSSIQLLSYNQLFIFSSYFPGAGNGKSHSIRKELLKYNKYVVIAINEAFTPLAAITKLCMLKPVANCSIYFNISLLPSQVRSALNDCICFNYA